jgi:hypothetical protein
MSALPPNTTPPHRTHPDRLSASALVFTLLDLGAALMFFIGSVLFFDPQTEHAGTWMFVVGSLMFGVRPGITLWRALSWRHDKNTH